MGLGPTGPKLWQVNIAGGKFTLVREEPLEGTAAVQPKVIGKDWNEFLRPKLNIGLLPPTQVFLRVVQLPKTDSFEETVSMLEFQLEKLSPLPVAQIAWTFELVSNQGLGDGQTAILVVVARSLVEELLGKFEGHGFLADRIELPFVDQLLGLEVQRDCAVLFPVDTGETAKVVWVAWWYGGVLQSIGQIHLMAEGSPTEALRAQLAQMAWAGELEGWLTTPPKYFLVGDSATAEIWKPILEGVADKEVEVIPPAPSKSLAALTAKRSVKSDPKVGLLPPDFTSRYRQQFIDKLWMQGLFGLLALYLFGLLIYFGIVAIKGWQYDSIQTQEIAQGTAYTNSVKLRDQMRVLQEQVNLQFAALNCYLVVATNLPPDLTLDSMGFDRGNKLSLFGSGSAGVSPQVNDFVKALKLSKINDQPVFKAVDVLSVSLKPGGAQVSWNVNCELRRTEVE